MTFSVIVAEILSKNFKSYFDYLEIHPEFIDELSDKGIYNIIDAVVNRRLSVNKGKAKILRKLGIKSEEWKEIGFWINKILEKSGKSKIVTSISLSPEVHRVLDDYKISGGNKSLFFEYAALDVFKKFGRNPNQLKSYVNRHLGDEYKESENTDKHKNYNSNSDVDELIDSIREDIETANSKSNELSKNKINDEVDAESDTFNMREILKQPNGREKLIAKGVPKTFLDRLSDE